MTRQERIKLLQMTFDDADKLAEEALDLLESVNFGDDEKGEAKLLPQRPCKYFLS